MPHYNDTQIQAANQVDLAAFLYAHGETLKKRGKQMLWEKHQVWIDGCRWYTHYDSKGGYAVKFVMRYFGLSFQDAVKELLGESNVCSQPIEIRPKEEKTLVLPNPNGNMNRVYAYLMQERFIDRDVISHFAHEKTLYEDEKYHNCIFIGKDEDGIPKHCHRRSTSGSFKQTEAGSLVEHSFHHDGESEWLFVFEAPIDMLAFLSLHRGNWQAHSYVALCSVSEWAILHRLKVNPKLKKIVLCLDNDAAGHTASVRIKELLQDIGYRDVRIHHPHNKDWDEDRKAQNGIAPIQAEEDQSALMQQWYHDVVEATSRIKTPPMLYEKTMTAYTAMCNANGQADKVGNFLMLILMLAKDECRKCLAPISWDELERLLSQKYISYADNGDTAARMRQIEADMQKMRNVYTQPQMSCDRNLFLDPILQVAMDCIRLMLYLDRKEKST